MGHTNDRDSELEKSTDPKDLLALAHKQYERATEYWYENWEQGRGDIRFAKEGVQWPETIEQQRKSDDRPCLTINRLPAFLRQVVGDQRQNRARIKVRPVDSNADPDKAELLEGLIRNIENISKFKVVTDTAFAHSTGNGFGYIRIVTEYAGPDTFEQDIKFKRVFNPFSVVLDPSAQEMDFSDGMFGFVLDWVPKSVYEERYPGKDKVDFNETRWQGIDRWHRDNDVLVAEWYRRVPIKKTIVELDDAEGSVMDKKAFEAIDWEGATPPAVVRDRDIEAYKVEHYVVSGMEILEGPTEWASEYIPLIPVLGEELCTYEGRKEYLSLVRFAKDPARMYNYFSSAAAERIALDTKAQYIGTAEQFSGFESEWAESNTKNRIFLRYKHDPKAPGPPQRQFGPQMSSAIVGERETAATDIKATMGMFDPSLGDRGTASQSGKAILALQREGDVGTFQWLDNLSIAIEHAGRIVVDLIPKIYDTERAIRIVGIDDVEKITTINQTNKDGSVENDLTVGKYDVVVETGPSYSTKRVEAADSMMMFIQAYPAAAPIIGDLIAKNMDWPGADEIAERLKKTLPPGMVEPEEGEEPPQPPAPTPEQQLQAKDLELKSEELKVDEEKIKLEYEKLRVEMEKVRTEEGLSEDQVRSIVIDVMREAHG